MESKCPCNGCEERYVGCHADCEKYKQWDIEHKAAKDAKFKFYQPAAQAEGYAIATAQKKKKRLGKGR